LLLSLKRDAALRRLAAEGVNRPCWLSVVPNNAAERTLMKTAMFLFAAALTAAWAAPASAAQESLPGTATPVLTQDFSAAKKIRRYHRPYYYGYYGAPYAYGYYGYGGADPTASRYSNLRRMQALGRCVYDLGYGRYKLCN
jgi:hypothetical protein